MKYRFGCTDLLLFVVAAILVDDANAFHDGNLRGRRKERTKHNVRSADSSRPGTKKTQVRTAAEFLADNALRQRFEDLIADQSSPDGKRGTTSSSEDIPEGTDDYGDDDNDIYLSTMMY